jgi:hypothetical protein
MCAILDFSTAVTIKARVAYFLATVETIFISLTSNDNDYGLARNALDTCWEWLGGRDLNGSDIYDLNVREDDEGYILGVAMSAISEKDSEKKNVWNTLAALILYLSWKLMKQEGATVFPEDMDGASEELINNIFMYAQQSLYFQESKFQPLKQYLLETYPSNQPDELGTSISKEEIMQFVPKLLPQ